MRLSLRELFCPSYALGAVTINDCVISKGSDINATGVLRVHAGDFPLDSIRVVNDGQVWIPLAEGSDYYQYILQATGSFQIFSGPNLVFNFGNSKDTERPSWLRSYVEGRLASSPSDSSFGPTSTRDSSSSYYINYATRLFDDYVCYCCLFYFDADIDASRFNADGGSITFSAQRDTFYLVKIVPFDDSSVVILRYDDYIIFVANYS